MQSRDVVTVLRCMQPSVALACLLALACNEHPLQSVEHDYPQEVCLSADDSGEGPGGLSLRAFNGCGIPVWRSNEIDVLFVVDRSPQGQAWQLQLADAMPRFVEALAEAEPAPDVRIGIVAAQGQGDACLDGPTLGGSYGVFSSRSCLERPEDFSSPEVFERACVSGCGSSQSSDAQWFRFAPGESEFESVAFAEQLRCAAILGDRGCTLAQPFGSVLAVLQRAREDGLFFRDEAVPMVVVVSGSVDCTAEAVGVLGRDTTPAECWAAGARCVEDGSNAWLCEPDADGDTGLVPVPEMLGWLEARAGWAHQLGLGPGHLALWMGWEPGTVGPGPVRAHPPRGDDVELGVAPTCVAGDSVALPPVRAAGLWAEAESRGCSNFDVSALSLCGDGLGSGMAALGERVADAVSPGCVPACVADEDEGAAGLQPDCDFVVTWRDGELTRERFVEACVDGEAGGLEVPEGDPGCLELHSGARLHPSCAAQGSNLSVALHWDGPEPPAVHLVASCGLSKDKATDCFAPPG